MSEAEGREEGEEMRDVVAVNVRTNNVRVMARNLTPQNAEAYVTLAVMRRGVTEEFFCDVESGTYNDGDSWTVQP